MWTKEHDRKVKFTATQYDNGTIEPGRMKVVVKDEGNIVHTQLGECAVDLNDWFQNNGSVAPAFAPAFAPAPSALPPLPSPLLLPFHPPPLPTSFHLPLTYCTPHLGPILCLS